MEFDLPINFFFIIGSKRDFISTSNQSNCIFNFFFYIYFIMLKLHQVPRKFSSKIEGKMNYEDFVYFILAEEDKSSEPSLEYWYSSWPSPLLWNVDSLEAYKIIQLICDNLDDQWFTMWFILKGF